MTVINTIPMTIEELTIRPTLPSVLLNFRSGPYII